MFWSVARYELKYRMTRVSTHVYALVFFALALLLGLAAAGAFEGVDMTAGARVLANSPYMVAGLVTTLGLFGVVVTASFMGQALVKDFEHTVHPLLFTTPLSKGAYLGGRYAGAAVAALYVMGAVLPGLALAFALPFNDADLVGPSRAAAYLQPYALFVVPNTLVTGALFFGLAALTRQMLPNYVGGVLLLMGYLMAAILTADTENLRAAALVDPFGNYAYETVTRYWTTAEKNTLLLPFDGLLALNRGLWLAVGAAALAVTFARFRLAQGVAGRRRKATAAPDATAERRPISALALPDAGRQFSAGARVRQTLSLARREWGAIVRNVYFYVLLLAAVGFFALGAVVGNAVFGTPTLPVTTEVLALVTGGFALFVLVIIVFYAGELVWRERDLKSAQIYDALPVPSWLPFVAKLLALWGAAAVVLATMMAVGIVYQLGRGFTDVEPGLYLAELFGVQFVDYALLAVMALTIHTIVNHKYVGHFVLILYLVGLPILMGIFGYDHNLYDFGSDPGTPYSDMNGYGHFLGPFVWFKLYWAAFAVLLAVASTLVWQRGPEGGVGHRLRSARLRLSRPTLATVAIALVAFVALGGFIFYNTNVLNDYRTEEEERDLLAEYERKYKQYEGIPQPRITAVETQVDLFPREREARLRGTYTLVNKTGVPVPAVHLDLPSSLAVRQLALPGAEPALVDSALGYRIYTLAEPLAPGDSTVLAFDLRVETEGFTNGGGQTSVVYNGTFLNNGVFPHVGYQRSGELADPSAREDAGLPPRPRAASIDDTLAVRNTDLASDADFVRFAATVSTTPDQIAIAPGRLQREWTENGRRYFRYEMGAPILNFYAFLSARYAVEEDTWTSPDGRTVDIQVFYHPTHDYNVGRMIEATKATLDYASRAFSPYQYDQVRIIEFPRYAQFAQSFPNTIPFSESIGFIADVGRGEDAIDYPYYVTAHEVAHQWWGHQVAGGAVQGSAVIVETLAQHTALMVMQKRYGEAQMGRFLGYELDQYLVGRALEREREVPLYLAEGQQYLHYNKGSLAMYALQEYVGEAKVNAALSRFVDRYAFRGPPYPTTRDLLRELRAVTPDSLGYLVRDLFETITLYENRAVSATASPVGDGRYRVTMELDLGKVRADSLGAEQPAPMNDWLEVAVYDEGGSVLASEQRRLRAGEQTVSLVVRGRPARAGVDPRNVFPDRVRADNTTAVSVE